MIDEHRAIFCGNGQATALYPLPPWDVTPKLTMKGAKYYQVKLPDGTPLIRGRQVTGFANSEEDFADAWMKTKVMPFRIEDEARKLGANFVTAPAFQPFPQVLLALADLLATARR